MNVSNTCFVKTSSAPSVCRRRFFRCFSRGDTCQFVVVAITVWFYVVPCLVAAGAPHVDGLSEFTGSRTRVVWCQQVDEGSDDTLARTDRFRLMGFDSTDGLGERILLDEVRNYRKPLLSPDGQSIVFSDWGKREFYVVEWGQPDVTKLANGMAVDVWRDPETGHDWVYAITREYNWERFRGTMVTRFRMDDPTDYQLAWGKSVVSADNWQLSRDGNIAGGLFPWPKGGLVDLRDKSFEKKGRGCWGSLAPDNSRLFWLFDGAHRNLTFYNEAGRSWKVNISSAPGLNGHEVYHPRWSNHVAFFAMTGPYKIQLPGKGGNAIHGGGDDVEIYVGAFNEPFTDVKAWFQLTQNNRGDFFPDVWIEGGEKVNSSVLAQQAYEGRSYKTRDGHLLIDAVLMQVTPIPEPDTILPYTEALVFHAYEVQAVLEGDLAVDNIVVAHWGIRSGKKVATDYVVGDKVRLQLESLENRPELDSERQLMEIDDVTLDAFIVVEEDGP